MRARVILIALLFLLVALGGCSARKDRSLVVGSKSFTEGAILGYIDLLLLAHAGYAVTDRIEMGPTLIVRQALLSDQVDTYVEYTGTALSDFFGVHDHALLADASASYQRVASEDLVRNHLVWLTPLALNNTYTVLMPRKKAQALGLHTLSQLATYARHHRLIFGMDPEFAARSDGWHGLQQAYEFRPSQVHQLDAGLVYTALHQGHLDAAIGYSTDGRIQGFDLARLVDDRHYFPVYHPAPVVRAAVLAAHPDIPGILDPVAPLLTDRVMTALNYQMDMQQHSARNIAHEWLQSQGFLKPLHSKP